MWNSRKCPDAITIGGVEVAAIVCAVAAPLAQQPGIWAVIRAEIVRVSPAPPPAAARNPDGSPNVAVVMSQMGDMLAKMMAPEGKVEMLWLARGGAARTELRNPMFMMPTGAVMITKGTTVTVLDPAEHTYYETSTTAPRMPGTAAGADAPTPEVTVRPTGKTDTLLGHPVERVDVTVRMPFPRRSAGPAPAGLPTEMTMTMESWETSDFGSVVDPALLAGIQGLMASAGIEKVVRPGRFPMKFVGRTSMLPGYEIRTTVLEVGQKPLTADLFEVPAGFRKVDPPRPRLP